jgi:hypothetical protein
MSVVKNLTEGDFKAPGVLIVDELVLGCSLRLILPRIRFIAGCEDVQKVVAETIARTIFASIFP